MRKETEQQVKELGMQLHGRFLPSPDLDATDGTGVTRWANGLPSLPPRFILAQAFKPPRLRGRKICCYWMKFVARRRRKADYRLLPLVISPILDREVQERTRSQERLHWT
jgi:hypothetical protein